VAVFAVVDEAGLERGLHAGDDRLVDVALALLAPFDFDFVVEQFLPVHNGQPAFFGLGGVDQHPFHRGTFVKRKYLPAEGHTMPEPPPKNLGIAVRMRAADSSESPRQRGRVDGSEGKQGLECS
jgi:hypothetical protein